MKLCVLAPHPDDEVLGCGGTIARRIAEGWQVDIVIASVLEVPLNGDGPSVCAQERLEDACRAAELLGAGRPRFLLNNGHTIGSMSSRDLVARLDALLEEGSYNEVLFPYASHHQEHRALHEAAFSALRPRPALSDLRRVAVYEYPWVGWDSAQPAGGRWYVDVGEYLETKVEALKAYRNLRHREEHPISVAGIRALAIRRGTECGATAAELFRVLRVVE